ncbi:hypothetical protein BJV82DRAFT_600602 [Fennellomyces sp. T-0311]|nr:hypothetical protein BJV82DRAFT_600602 [Fennellomyces sp. T-0311]
MAINRCCFCFSLYQAPLIITTASAVVYGAVFVWLLVRHEVILGFFQEEPGAINPILWLLVPISGLACLYMLFGAFASLRQSQRLLKIFLAMYWAMSGTVFVLTLASWAVLLAKRNAAVSSCETYLSQVRGSRGLPGSGVFGVYDGDCERSVRNMCIVGGFIVFIGNALQFYFAFVVTTAVKNRTKATAGHQQLRDLEDHYQYPLPQQQFYYAAQPVQPMDAQKPPKTY